MNHPKTESTYRITRFYSPKDGRPNETVKEGLTLDEAQTWCENPETQEAGVYFDGYEEE
jgi:hypothetical protein